MGISPGIGQMILPTDHSHWRLNGLLRTERLGAGWLVLTDDEQSVYRVDGPAAEVVTRLTAGETDLPDHLGVAVSALVSHGIVVTSDRGPRVSRRTALSAAAGVVVAAGIQVVRLPAAAAASSAFDYSATGAASTSCVLSTGLREIVFTSTGSFLVTAGETLATVTLIGGGGSGSVRNTSGGAGGGGGDVVTQTITITPDAEPGIVVGQGGATRVGDGAGNDGTQSIAFGVTANGGSGGSADGKGGTSGSGQPGGDATGVSGGGGGGAGGAGGTDSSGGLGGAGLPISTGGVTTNVGGGGGGAGGDPPGTGVAGGGTGQVTPGDPGTQASGGVAGSGGGGGGAFSLVGGVTNPGGSGRVIIRFADATCPVS